MIDFTATQRARIMKRDGYNCQVEKFWGKGNLPFHCSEKLMIWRKILSNKPPKLSEGITVCEKCYGLLEMMVNSIKRENN